jgi:CRP-like cAMP-binding protein
VVDSETKMRLFREQGLSNSELMALATFSRERTYPGGGVIFGEGDAGREMFVVLDGRVRISKFIPGGGEEALAILERGDFFGEMALIDGQPRSADARAHGGPVTVLALDEGTIREVLTVDPHASLEFLQLLCRLVAKRLREIDEKVIGWRIMVGQGEQASA